MRLYSLDLWSNKYYSYGVLQVWIYTICVYQGGNEHHKEGGIPMGIDFRHTLNQKWHQSGSAHISGIPYDPVYIETFLISNFILCKWNQVHHMIWSLNVINKMPPKYHHKIFCVEVANVACVAWRSFYIYFNSLTYIVCIHEDNQLWMA